MMILSPKISALFNINTNHPGEVCVTSSCHGVNIKCDFGTKESSKPSTCETNFDYAPCFIPIQQNCTYQPETDTCAFNVNETFVECLRMYDAEGVMNNADIKLFIPNNTVEIVPSQTTSKTAPTTKSTQVIGVQQATSSAFNKLSSSGQALATFTVLILMFINFV
ncbi:hypothetical protein HDU92_007514 [Lobulomyces angularis]|nr:hypothetical protein HDU92_007514 [Lobulomyces angularis]